MRGESLNHVEILVLSQIVIEIIKRILVLTEEVYLIMKVRP